MDPVTLAIGLAIVFGRLAGRAADVTLSKGLDAIIDRGAEKAKLREAEAKALGDALAAARRAGGAEVGTRLGRALNKVKDNRALAARVVAAAIEMTSEDPRRGTPHLPPSGRHPAGPTQTLDARLCGASIAFGAAI